MDEMIQYTQDEIAKEPTRSIATDSEAVFLHSMGKITLLALQKTIRLNQNPRFWIKHNIPNQLFLKAEILKVILDITIPPQAL